MRYRVDTIDIIGSVVAAMQFPMQITSVTEIEPGKYILTVCDIRYAQAGFTVTIGGNDYKIILVNPFTNQIIVSGTVAITVYTFDLYRPHYFHGTPIAMNVELDKKKQATDKTPMIWLMEQFKDRYSPQSNDPIEREIECKIFFLSTGNSMKWTIDQSYTLGVLPMSRLQQHFELQLREMTNLFAIDTTSTQKFEYDTRNYHAFGVYVMNKGMLEAQWVDNLSGVEMSIPSLKVFHDGLCDVYCVPYSPPVEHRSFNNSFNHSFS